MDARAAAVLLHPRERVAEMIMRGIDRRPQQALQPVPRGEDLRQGALADDAAGAVDGDARGHFDAEVGGAGAAFFQRLEQLGMGGDPGAAADQFHRRTLEHVHVPADPAQKRRREQARHRAPDDHGVAVTRHCSWARR